MSIPGSPGRGFANVTTAFNPGDSRNASSVTSSTPTTQISASAFVFANQVRTSFTLAGHPNRAMANARDGSG